MATAYGGGLSGPGGGSGISPCSGGKNGISDLGKEWLDYDNSYRNETNKLLGIKTCLTMVFVLMLVIIIL